MKPFEDWTEFNLWMLFADAPFTSLFRDPDGIMFRMEVTRVQDEVSIDIKVAK